MKKLGLATLFAMLLFSCAGDPVKPTGDAKRITSAARPPRFSAPVRQSVLPRTPPRALPTEPILRINTVMHTDSINAIAVDAEETILVSCSDDKTIRVWDLATSALQKVLRVPGDDQTDGRLYSLSLSPDGKTLAVGGLCGGMQSEDNIYIFDIDTGAIVHRISGLPEAVLCLSFSKNGRYLAAGLAGNEGLQVYETEEWGLTAVLAVEERPAGNNCRSLDFAPDGQLATASDDGHVRLFARDFRLLKEVMPSGGKQPASIAFSPNGRKIAVGFNDTRRVDILSAERLKWLDTLGTYGKPGDYSTKVAWSADSKTVYAGGRMWPSIARHTISAWDLRDRKSDKAFNVSRTTISDIVGLKSGRIAFGTMGPAWGILSSNGQIMVSKKAGQANPRGNHKRFRVSPDGARVQFNYKADGGRSALFDVSERTLTLSSSSACPDCTPPVTKKNRLNITDWQHTDHPGLNGKRLALNPHEQSHSLAMAPDGKTFVLGTEWHVRCFDSTGRLLWQQPTACAYAVNISGDGKTVVAFLDDGTLRWYRQEDGQPLLSLFPHTDGKRWVLWTPAGYYAASDEGEELIGWQLNQGRDQAPDFFPAERFHDIFHQPEITTAILETLDEKTAIDQTIKPFETRVAVNPDQPGRVESVPSSAHMAAVTAPSRQRPAPVAPAPPPAPAPAFSTGTYSTEKAPNGKPRLYILAIGASQSQNENTGSGLRTPDAEALARLFLKKEGERYSEVALKLLSRGDKSQVRNGLEWLKQNTTTRDVAMVFLTGQGMMDRNGNYCILPSTAMAGNAEDMALSCHELQQAVISLPGKSFIFLDTYR